MPNLGRNSARHRISGGADKSVDARLNGRTRRNEHSQREGCDVYEQRHAKRTARAWLYREGLRAILDRKQINVVAAMLKQWCTNVLRSKSLPSRKRGWRR